MIRPILTAILLLGTLTAQAAESIRIGLSIPTTGRYKEQGQAQSRGALLAVDEVNRQGGVLGRPLELLIANTASKPERAEETVRELTQQNAAFIFGGASSEAALAAGQEAARQNKLFIAAMGYANNLTNEAGQRYFFRETYNAHMAAKALSLYLNDQLQGKKVFYLTANYAWGWSVEESMRAYTHTSDSNRHPGVLVTYPRPRRSDFDDALNQAEASGADVLVLIQFGEDMATALDLATRKGLKKKMTIVVPNLTLGMAALAGPEVMAGVIGAVPWYWQVPYANGYEKGQQFVEAFVKRFNEYPSTSAASAYSIVLQFRDAATKAGSLDTARLIKALEGHRYSALKDEQVWRALDHQNQQSVYVVEGRERDEVLKSPLHSDYFRILQSVSASDVALPESEWKAIRKAHGKGETL